MISGACCKLGTVMSYRCYTYEVEIYILMVINSVVIVKLIQFKSTDISYVQDCTANKLHA